MCLLNKNEEKKRETRVNASRQFPQHEKHFGLVVSWDENNEDSADSAENVVWGMCVRVSVGTMRGRINEPNSKR